MYQHACGIVPLRESLACMKEDRKHALSTKETATFTKREAWCMHDQRAPPPPHSSRTRPSHTNTHTHYISRIFLCVFLSSSFFCQPVSAVRCSCKLHTAIVLLLYQTRMV